MIFLSTRFRSRFNEAFGADTPTKPPLYSGRGRPPKKIALNLPNVSKYLYEKLRQLTFYHKNGLTKMADQQTFDAYTQCIFAIYMYTCVLLL